MAPLAIGIVSESLVQQHYLHHIVQECGYTVVVCYQLKNILSDPRLLKNPLNNIDAWLVDIDTTSFADNSRASEFEEWLYNLELPVIFSEGQDHNAADATFCSWSRQLKRKLQRLTGQLRIQGDGSGFADIVWVLAASAGGPTAVKRFLSALPAKIGVGFIYVQHIDAHQNRLLVDIISRDSAYAGYTPEHGDSVRMDSVAVVSTKDVMEIQQDGTIVIYDHQAWRGNYSPSIDQVIANVGDIYGPLSGAIFFSGMGDDGAIGSRLMAIHGGNIWIQLPETCQSPSMPTAIQATGCVTNQGTPEQLAAGLVKWRKRQT